MLADVLGIKRIERERQQRQHAWGRRGALGEDGVSLMPNSACCSNCNPATSAGRRIISVISAGEGAATSSRPLPSHNARSSGTSAMRCQKSARIVATIQTSPERARPARSRANSRRSSSLMRATVNSSSS